MLCKEIRPLAEWVNRGKTPLEFGREIATPFSFLPIQP